MFEIKRKTSVFSLFMFKWLLLVQLLMHVDSVEN